MNIGIDIRCLLTKKDSGVTVYTRNLLHALLKNNTGEHNFYIYINSWNKKKVEELEKEFSIYPHTEVIKNYIPNKLANILAAYYRGPSISKKIRTHLDTFFVPDPRPSPVASDCKKVTTFHDLSFEHYSETFSWKTRFWHRWILQPKREARESKKIIAVSQSTKDDLIETYKIPTEKIFVIHEGVGKGYKKVSEQGRLEEIRKKYKLPEKFFLSLSTLEPRKNIQTLVDAFVEWKNKKTQPHHLVIAGDYNPYIFKKGFRINIPERYKDQIHLVGYVETTDKPTLYSLADGLYFISLYEGFGLPILEAMACECPVVTSNTSSMPEVAGEATILIPPKDKVACIRSFDEILSRGDELRQKGKTRAEEFSWEKCAAETLRVLTS